VVPELAQQRKDREIYKFGPFQLDVSERILLRDGQPVRLAQKDGGTALLTPKVVDTLLALVERDGQIVGKDELMRAVWPDTVVEEGNLSANISLLRKALGSAEDGQPYIETFPKRGYRFNARVEKLSPETSLELQTDASEERDTELVISKRTRTRVIARVAQSDEFEPQPVVAPVITVPALIGRTRKRNYLLVAGIVAAVLVIAVGAVVGGLYLIRQRRLATSKSSPPFSQLTVLRLTANGTASQSAISPDGQYIVHVSGGAGQQSLQLKHVATGNDQEIVPPAKENFSAVSFSRDGHSVYYIKYSEQEGGLLSQIPTLGGAPKVLAKDVDGCASFSPDQKSFAFIRGLPVEGSDALIIANIEGGERKLISHKLREIFADASINSWGPAWSPDGALIAFPLRAVDEQGNEFKRVMLARVSDGVETPLTSHKWFSIGQIAWLPDRSGLIVAAAEQEQDAPHQLWHVSYPDGAARRITNDLSNYDGVSLTADGDALITVQSDRRANIWITSRGDQSEATELPSDKSDGMGGLSWTPDGHVVYASITNGNSEIWIMDADGSNRKQLTVSDASDRRPTVSADGRYIVFVSDRTGAENIWRMDIDGRNLRQLTNQRGDDYPYCTPDNRWIVYASDALGKRSLWRIAIEGGVPEPITDYTASLPAVSPDGKSIACSYVDERETPRRYVTAIISFDGGRPARTFPIPRSFTQVVRWTPDSRALTYLVTRAGVSNIWRQNLDGSAPVAWTDFKTGIIFRYDWSRDGKRLVLARGSVTSDVVLIKNSAGH
jgi:Tol biopolymer transport system component/DNA-binding winged helix-turn-helix (wHTH) protein